MPLPPSPRRPSPRLLALTISVALTTSVGAAPAVAASTPVVVAATTPAPVAGSMPLAMSPLAPAQPEVDRVLAISIDGLNPKALRRVGRTGAPYLWRLVDEGAHTLNARTSVELTDTLPNHTGMVTGRRVKASRSGHGVTWNDDRLDPRTVGAAAGHEVSSVFTVVHQSGGSTALFSTKTKLSLFERSWSDDVDRATIKEEADGKLSRAARRDLVKHGRELTFVHFGAADVAGHAHGFMSRKYLDAVRRLDGLVGRLVKAIETKKDLAGTAIVLTADHGGTGSSHGNPTKRANYRIPFTVWGPGVRAGGLYGRNPSYDAPGKKRVRYSADDQPVRNGNVASDQDLLVG